MALGFRRWTETVHEFEIVSPGGARASILNWGAVVRDMQVRLRNGAAQRVVLGFENFESYPAHSPYFGAVCGRVANRIAKGRYRFEGRDVVLAANEGEQCLHGGPGAISHRVWQVLDHTEDSVTLSIVLPDGENGFPGTVHVVCTYRLENEADLVCDLTATSDAPTPVNLAQHNYYNLDGSADIGDHDMQVMADFHTPNDAKWLPTGEIRSLNGSPYDFRVAKPLKQIVDGERFKFDGSFVLPAADQALVHGASVTSRVNGLRLEIHTDQPGLQFYDGHKMNIAVPGHGGATYRACGGFCLEPQKFPDGVNRRHFPDTILRPGAVYRQTSLFRFVAG